MVEALPTPNKVRGIVRRFSTPRFGQLGGVQAKRPNQSTKLSIKVKVSSLGFRDHGVFRQVSTLTFGCS